MGLEHDSLQYQLIKEEKLLGTLYREFVFRANMVSVDVNPAVKSPHKATLLYCTLSPGLTRRQGKNLESQTRQ